MSQPEQPMPWDMGNPLLDQCPARIDSAVITEGGVKFGVLTIRTASTTMTVILDANACTEWGKILSGLGREVGGSLQVATAADVSAMTQAKGLIRPPQGR